jgi:NAD-dependent dihydropyrimidine dehydrogenase PreA subunit
MPVQVDVEQCDGCRSCEEVCPTHAITVPGDKAAVVPDDCIDCNACTDACTHNALSTVD